MTRTLDLQRDTLMQTGCFKLYEDKDCGAKTERPVEVISVNINSGLNGSFYDFCTIENSLEVK